MKFQQIINGELNYLTQVSRPDIAFAVNKVARRTKDATNESLTVAKNILSYCHTTKEFRINYDRWKNESVDSMVVYCDSSFADQTENNYRSSSGFLIYINGQLIDWKNSKLQWVPTSTCTAEFLSLFNAIVESVKLANVAEEVYDLNIYPITIYCDNKCAIDSAKNGNGNDITRFAGSKYGLIGQLLEKNMIKIKYVKSKENKSDGLTKALNVKEFAKFTSYLFENDLLNQQKGNALMLLGNSLFTNKDVYTAYYSEKIGVCRFKTNKLFLDRMLDNNLGRLNNDDDELLSSNIVKENYSRKRRGMKSSMYDYKSDSLDVKRARFDDEQEKNNL